MDRNKLGIIVSPGSSISRWIVAPTKINNIYIDFTCYKIQQFGGNHRNNLPKRWPLNLKNLLSFLQRSANCASAVAWRVLTLLHEIYVMKAMRKDVEKIWKTIQLCAGIPRGNSKNVLISRKVENLLRKNLIKRQMKETI